MIDIQKAEAIDKFLDCFNRFRSDRRVLLAQIRLNELQASLKVNTPDSTLRRIQRLCRAINRRIS